MQVITPELNQKQLRVKRLIEYAEKWDCEQYGYVAIDYKGALIRTNNIDCDGMRYFNKKTFIKYIDRVMEGGA
jgi:hypothetical protein